LFLRAAGVHSMQGYRFGEAETAEDVSARIAAASRRRDTDGRTARAG
jgi:EAL domain-containing protein (putative c-di-GMP-specific phosphodiesterase class I)